MKLLKKEETLTKEYSVKYLGKLLVDILSFLNFICGYKNIKILRSLRCGELEKKYAKSFFRDAIR